ncbi:MAG: hypothetical protein ACQESG_01715 [Nanobdellota archaeon]
MSYAGLRYASVHGVRNTILISVPLMVTFFFLLYNIDRFTIPAASLMILLALVRSCAITFYWTGFHVEFAKYSRTVIKQFGVLRAFSTVFSVIGPLFGALIATFFSFQVLFIFVMLTLILSVVPLFFSKEVYEPFDFSLRNLVIDRQAIPFFAEGFRDSAAKYFWPLLMFMLALPLISIGSLYTVSSGLLAAFMFYLGRRTNDHNKHRILWFGVVGNAFSLFGRTLVTSFTPIMIMQGIGGLSWTMVQLPFHSIFYCNSQQSGICHMVYFRELFLNLGRMLCIGVLALFVVFKPATIALAFTITAAAFAMLFMGTIKDTQTEKA